jgi:hypothetical protein
MAMTGEGVAQLSGVDVPEFDGFVFTAAGEGATIRTYAD